MPKRYRRITAKEGELKLGFGSAGDGSRAGFVAAWGDGLTGAHGNFVLSTFCHERHDRHGHFIPSLMDELEQRGFDTTTIKFSIQKKAE